MEINALGGLKPGAPRRIILATRNQHKSREIMQILGGDWLCTTLDSFPGVPELIEDTATFHGNAARKAEQLLQWLCEKRAAETGTWVLADDSGLEVDALNGAPGVYSARYAGMADGTNGNSPDGANNARLLQMLEKVPDSERTARFRCVLALGAVGQGTAELRYFEGTCEGRIARQESGGGGFGYDPLFLPDGRTCSFAELPAEVKNQISHRAKALEALGTFLRSTSTPNV